MKNRKTIIVAFLLVAALCLGIGYAALTDELSVKGVANVESVAAQTAFDVDVYFDSSYEQPQGSICSVAYESGTVPDAVTITVTEGVGVVGDTVTAKLKIKNDGSQAAAVALKAVTADGQNYFAAQSTHFSITAGQDVYEVPAAGSVEVDITITVIKTIETDVEETFAIYFEATSAV